MFRLEKVFQNDDKGFVLLTNFIKVFTIFGSIYIYSILENRSIYQLFDFSIFVRSEYFLYAFFLPIVFFIIISSNNKSHYEENFISFLKKDILSFIFSNILIFSFFFIFNVDLNFNKNLLYLIVFLLSILSII
jgi:hypothetical protein